MITRVYLVLVFPMLFVARLVSAVGLKSVWFQSTSHTIKNNYYSRRSNAIRHFMLAFVLVALVLAVLPPVFASSTTVVCSSSKWRVEKNADAVNIFYKRGSQFPQYGALDLASSYFRLNYGPTSGWGTSIVLLPAFWSGGIYHQGARVSLTCSATDQNLVLSIKGTITSLKVSDQVTLSPPTDTSITARVVASVQGSVPLDKRLGEAFKPVFLSSMHISAARWDTRKAYADSRSFSIPASGWLIPSQPSVTAGTFGLVGGTSAWKTNAPSIRINLSLRMQVAGWVTSSANPNHDNVGLWAASNTLLSSYSYQIVVSRAS